MYTTDQRIRILAEILKNTEAKSGVWFKLSNAGFVESNWQTGQTLRDTRDGITVASKLKGNSGFSVGLVQFDFASGNAFEGAVRAAIRDRAVALNLLTQNDAEKLYEALGNFHARNLSGFSNSTAFLSGQVSSAVQTTAEAQFALISANRSLIETLLSSDPIVNRALSVATLNQIKAIDAQAVAAVANAEQQLASQGVTSQLLAANKDSVLLLLGDVANQGPANLAQYTNWLVNNPQGSFDELRGIGRPDAGKRFDDVSSVVGLFVSGKIDPNSPFSLGGATAGGAIGVITNYPDIAAPGGTLVFANGATLTYGSESQVTVANDGGFATVVQVLDAAVGIQIEYRIDAFGQSSGGQLSIADPSVAGGRKIYSFTDQSQIRLAPGGGAFLLNDGVSGMYFNMAAGDAAGNGNGGRVILYFDPATGQGNLYRQNSLNAGFTMEVIPAGSRIEMQLSGSLLITKPDNSAISVAAPGVASPLGGSVVSGYQIIREVAPGLFLGRSNAGGGAQMLYTQDTGDNNPVVAWVPVGAKIEALKTNPTDSYASVILITDPATKAQTYYDIVTRTSGRFDGQGNGEFILPDGTRQKVAAGEWYVTSNGTAAIYNKDGSVSMLSKVGDTVSFDTYAGPELRRLSSLPQAQVGTGANTDGSPRVTQAGQVAWSTGSNPQEFANLVGGQLLQALGVQGQAQIDASKAALQQLTSSYGEPTSATILSNGTVLVEINGQKYAVNGAEAARFSLDEFNTLRITVVTGPNAGQVATFDNFTAFASANPDSKLGGIIPTSAVLQSVGAAALTTHFSGVEDDSGSISYSGDVQYHVDSDGYIVDNEIENVVGTISTGSGVLQFSVDWTDSGFEVGQILAINGHELTSSPNSISMQDIGLSLDDMVDTRHEGFGTGSGVTWVDSALSQLVLNLDPAVIQSNGWAYPQLVTTDLGDGLTQRSVTLGNGTVLSSVRNEDRLLISASQVQEFGDGSSITTTNYPNGNSQAITTDSDGSVYRRSETQVINPGLLQTRTYDGAGALLSTGTRQTFNDGDVLESVATTTSGSAGTVIVTTDIKRHDGAGDFAGHNIVSVTTNAAGLQLGMVDVSYNEQGQITQTRVAESLPNGTQAITVRDAQGNTVSTGTLQIFDDGSTLEVINPAGGGQSILRATDHASQVRNADLLAVTPGQSEQDRQKLEATLYADVGALFGALRAKDNLGAFLYGAKIVVDQQMLSNNTPTLQGINSGLSAATSVLGVIGALRGLQSNNALTQIGSAVSLLTSANNLYASFNNGAGFMLQGSDSMRLLGQIGAILSIANLANLGDMLDHGQYGSALSTVTGAYSGLSALTYSAGSAATATSPAVAASGLVPIDPYTLVIIVVASFILDEMFAEEEPPPPPPVGEAFFTRLQDGSLSYQIVNAGNGGAEILAAKMEAMIAKLTQQVAQANNGNTDPDQALALIASRMPTVRIQSWPSRVENGVSNFFFVLEQIHPQTGEKMYNGVARQDLVDHYAESLIAPEAIVSRWQINHLTAKFGADEANWKTEGQWLSAMSPIEQQRHALQQALSNADAALESAKQSNLALGSWVAVGAVTGNVEQGAANVPSVVTAAEAGLAAATAALKAYEAQHPGDPQLAARIVDAAITDPVQRAAAIESASRQWLKVIAVDLGGDGITKTALPAVVKQDYDSLQSDGVARFDADNDGYREATEWIAPSEAMLGIDRDGNGLIDTASELFNGVSTPFDQRGLASLKYYDSNNDGKIDASDPVYKLLRLWIDLNGDGSAGSMEIYDLQMRHPGVDMAALRARLDAAGQAAMDALAGSAVQSIDLTTFKLRLADGTDAQASEVGLQAQTEGIAVVVDQATQNVSILHENGLRENYITLVQDMSVLLELQNANITTARRAELEALALRYGLNTQSADFINVVKSLRAGGENIGASGMAIYIGDSDVWVDANVRSRLEQMRFSFHAASTVGGADVFGTAHLSPPVWAGPSTDTPVFDDQWALSHHVTTGEVTSDTATAGPPAPPNPQQWVLPSDVYTLDYVVKGAQLGGLVTQQAVIASNAATPGAPAQTIQVYTTASPTSSLGTAVVVGKEDEQFAFGYEQLEQEARTLIAGATPYTTVRLLGVREVRHGYVEVDDVTGRIRFIADANYFGTEAGFSYAVMDGQGQVMERRINFNLAEVNDAPKLLGETIQAQEDVPLLLDAATLLANDTDLEGDTLTIIGIGRVGMGRAELLANGQISYKPPTDLYGVTDTIEYIVQDSRGASAVAVIKIKLTAVNDAPTVVSEVIRNAKEDTNLRIDAALLLANDFDPDFNAQAGAAPLHITAVGNAVHGQAFVDGTGQIIFVPDENFNGTATFEYTVTDDTGLSTVGKAEVEVGAVNDGPRAFGEVITSNEDEKLVIDADLLLANEEDADIQRGEQQHLMVVAVDQAVNGTVALEGGHIVFTPASNYSGEASFRYTVSDGAGGLSQAVAKVNIAAVNDAPTLFNRAFQGTEETPLNITVSQLLAGVLDPEDGAAGISLVEARNAVGGTLERSGDTFTFTPGANFTGAAHFDYVVQDAQGNESVAVVTMSFNNVNDAPVFVAGSHLAKAGQEDQEVRISLSALKQMFVDVDGDAITVDTANLVAVNSGDTIRFDAQTQEIVFKAKANANGTRQFDVRVQDSNGVYSAYERLDIGIQALNDAPIVNAVGFQMLEDGGYNDPNLQAWSYISYSSLLSGASDADGDGLSILGAANGRTLNGRLVNIVNDAANNRVGILAPLNYNGAITFDFTVGDGHGGQASQKAYGNVVAVNDLPTANVVALGAPLLFAGGRISEYYRLDTYDVEDGSNSTVTIERNPLWAPVYQGVTAAYVYDTYLGENGQVITLDEGGWKEVAAPANYFSIPASRVGQSASDSVTFRITDSQGGFNFRSVNFFIQGYDPVVIDLGGDGLEFLDIDESQVTVDRDGDGVAQKVAWIGANEGILAWDHNHDNQINQADEVEFWSHVNPQDPARTDLQSLARPEFDTNQDGKFDSSDAKWSEFKLWRDLNGNGVSDAGELQTLADAGLKALHLNANVLNRRYGEDVLVRGYTRAEMTDGRMLQAGDVQLDIEDLSQIPVANTPTQSQQEAQVIAVTDVQALAQQQQQQQAAAMRAGSPEFSGALRDQKVLTGQAYRYVLPEALFTNLGAGAHYAVTLASGQPLPAWLHFDAATRTLSGSPTEGQAGEWTIKVIGTDASNAVSAGVMTLSVAQFNQAPVEYGNVPIQFADEDQLFTLDIAPNFFIDKDTGDQIHFSATLANGSPLPDWLHFDAQAMRFYGTPGGGHVGTLEIKLTAADEANATADTRFKIVVAGINDAPYLTGPVPTIGMTAGVANSFVMPQNLFADQDLGDVLRLSVSVADGSPLPAWLTYDSATRTLSANPTAEQISAPLQLRVTATDLAGVSTSTLMTVASMIQGTAADDVLNGSAYSEYIWGDAGNDLLDGQAGADRLIGGLGDDRYVVDALDVVVERANEGLDTVFSAGNWTLGDNLENLTLTGHLAVNATGNSLANVLSGNSADNILSGGAGDDVYLFGFGSGHDTLVESAEAGAGTDRVQFMAGVAVGDVWVSADANYVYLNLVDGTNRLAIQRVAGGGIGVESVRFADGTNWDQAAVMSRVVPNPAPLSAAPGYFRIATEDLLFEDTSPGTWFTTSSPSLTYWAKLGNGDALPSWLTLDPVSGKFSGLPQNGDVAAFEVRLYAKDSYGAVSSTLVQFLVTNTNDAPTAAAPGNQQVGKNQPFVYVLPSNTFADVDVEDALTLEATRSNGAPLPSWLTFDATTRTFSGTPPANADETVKISVRATDGSGAYALTGFSLEIGNMLTGTAAAETLTGTSARDLVYGLDGNDTLNAGAGNDLLDGGAGADVLNGGAGDDIYVVDNAADSVVETTSTTIYVDQGQYVTTYVDQGYYSTRYVDQGYYRYYYMDEGSPIYFPEQRYNENGDALLSPEWVSVMVPQTYWVPNVVPQTTWVPNVVAQTVVSDSGGVDTVNASISYVLGTNQENLTLTGSAALNGTGNALNNVLTGNTGANMLDGGAGADTLDGGTDDDLLIGGQGNDRYIYARGYGRDTVSDTDTTANNVDTLVMQAGIAASDVTVSRTATQMVLTLSASDQVLIDWDVASGKRIERVEFADGTVWTASDLLLMSNRAPTFAAPANQSTAEDAVWSYTLPVGTFADLDAGDVLSYSARLADGSALPGWLSFNAATHTFSGTPLNANVGLLALKVTATDTQGATVSGTFNVTVTNTNDAPTVLVPLPGQLATETQAFSYVVPANIFTDMDVGDTLVLSAVLANGSALPSWLTFDAATRTLSGTPPDTAAGVLGLAIKATDSAGAFALANLSLDITNVLTGTAAAETLTGTSARDLVYGLDGNDTLNAGAGNDLLDGGAGADVLNGGAGDDIYVVDNAADSVVETTSTTIYVDQGQYVTTYVDQGYYSTRYVDQGYYRYYYMDEGSPIYFPEQRYNENGDALLSPEWVSVMVPQTYWVPNVVPQTTWVPNVVAQTVVSDSGGVDTVNASISYVLGTNQENLTLTGSAALNGTGNALNNVLTGNTGANMLDGGAGADTLDGGTDDDLLIGGQGNDRYIYARGYGRDTVSDTDTTANNVDTLVMQAGIAASDVTVSRTATQMVLTLSASDQVLIDWDVASGKRIERVEFADGTVWTASDLLLMSNRAPTFAAPANQSTAEDAVWSYTLPVGTFADLDAGDVLSYSARLADGSALPGWLSFNAATHTFSGTPLNANVGLLALKVTATDTQGATVSGTFNVTVINTNDAPTVVASLQNQQVNEDQVFSYVVPMGTFGDVDLGDTLTYNASRANGAALPSWLTFNAATRTFSGTPLNADVGVLALKVTATDSAGAAVSSAFNVTIANTNDSPTVLTALQNQQVNEDQAFSYVVPANAFGDVDAGDVLTFSASLATGAALPAWLSFNATTRTFSGTPLNADVGTLALKVTATDTAGAAIGSVFNVTVTNTNDAPTVLAPLQNQQASETQAFSYVLPVGTFGDVDVGDSLVLSATLAGGAALPSWLTFNSSTRTLSGTPPDTASGIVSLSIKATDAAGAFVLAGFSLDIANVINGTASAETLTGTTGRDLMYGLDGNDTLNAGTGNDLLDGGAGADVLNGGAGDDIYVVDNAGDSVVETTSTTTYVDQGHYATAYTDQGYYRYYYYNEGSVVYLSAQGYDEYGNPMYTPEWVSVMVPYTYWAPNVVAQTVVSDSGGVDTVSASVNYVLGTNQENLTLTGSAAINGTGNALNNVLTGNNANNVLAGGGGSDTYLLGRGANTDTIQENDSTAGNNDVVKFMPSVAADQIWFRQVNNDLEASIVGTGDKFIISNWYLGAQYRVEEFKTTDGSKTLLASQVQNLVSAMASFSPPTAGQTTLPSNYSTALAPVIAANWQ